MVEPLADELSYTPELRERILAGFRGDVPPLSTSWTYRMALVAVAFLMVLLPVVYVALIAGGVWGLWIYTRFFFSSILPGRPGAVVIAAAALPLFVGAVVIVCLVKPLFARPARPDRPMKLDPRDEPLLFAFVARLCEAVHAPVPREIRVDCQVNASASFRRGLLSLFSDDMVLTLGLPLVEGLTLQQLAGIMAHELGHFGQRAGMRVSMLIHMVNFWFARLVYDRDRLDVALHRLANGTRLAWLRWYFRIALFSVSMTRRVLWALMMLGHMVSSFMMRQKEYDADRYAVRLAGFSAFDFTMREIFALSIAHDMTLSDLNEQWKEGRLVNNFPRLVVLNRREAARQIAPRIEHAVQQEEEELFSTHPTTRQRTARALREKGVGIFSSDLPATVLFYDCEKLSREVSLAYYQGMVGNQVQASNLVPLHAVQERQERDENERGALDRFFQNPNWLRGLPLPQKLPPLPADPQVVLDELDKARRAILGTDADHAREIQKYREAIDARVNALQAHALRDAGFRIDPGSFGLASSDPVVAIQEAERAEGLMRASAIQLERYEKLEVRRLGLSLVLLEASQVAARIREVEAWRQEVPKLLACAAFLTGKFPQMLSLRTTQAVMGILLHQIRPDQDNSRLFAVIAQRLAGLQEQLKDLHRDLRSQPYPFEHARQGIHLGDIAIPSMPAADDLDGLMGMTEHALGRLLEIYGRLLGRMAWMAEKVEEALGKPPLVRSAAAAGPGTGDPASAPAPVQPMATVTLETIAETRAEAVESRDAFPRYFRAVIDLRPLPLPESCGPAPDVRPVIAALREARQAAVGGSEAYAQRARRYREVEQQLGKAARAEHLLLAGLDIQAETFGLTGGDVAAAREARSRAQEEMAKLETGLRAFEEIQAQRLASALTLLQDDRVASRVPDGPRRRSETGSLLAAGAILHSRFPLLREIRDAYGNVGALGAALRTQAGSTELRSRFEEQVAQAHRQLQDLQRLLHRDPNPFAAPRGAASLAALAVPDLPAGTDAQGIFQAMALAIRELLDLHQRVLGRLAGTAEKVEQALDLR